MPLLDGVNITGLALAALLPWLAGTSLVRLLLREAPVAVALGHGYLLGQLLVIALMLLWDRLGMTLAWWPLLATMAVLAAMTVGVCGWRESRCTGRPWWSVVRLPRPAFSCRDLLWLLPLLAFLWLRGHPVAQQLLLQPLYPWDAWMNWVPRAVVWFEHGSLTEFVSPEAWLQAPAASDVYTLGNAPASSYPRGIPLLLLWHMLGAGTADHTLLYLPWLLLPVAAALALWGHLRASAAGRALAAVAVYCLLSMPLPTTHVALAGYADLWLGVAFAMGAMALAGWQHSGCVRYGLLTVAMALLCALFKNPGLGFGALLIAGLLLMLWQPPRRWLAGLTTLGLAVLTAGLAAGLHPGWVTQFDALPPLELPGPLPELKFRISPLLPHLGSAFYVKGNWHLLGVLVPAVLLANLLLRPPRKHFDIALLMLLVGFALLVLVFGFTQYAGNVETGTTIHRAFLYVTPLAVYVSFAHLALLLQPATATALGIEARRT